MESPMTVHEIDVNLLKDSLKQENLDDEYSIPLDISDIISICREYASLGWQIQSQIENILEIGVDEAIKTGVVKKESLQKIKNFLLAIGKNAYFGDAVSQASDCINLIKQYEDKNKIKNMSNLN